MRKLSDDDRKEANRKTLRALPGYPWMPCPICAGEGYANATGSCDHTGWERARAALPGLVLGDDTKTN
jgi:hypothetical protein